jgi:hypothetical protein
MAAKRKMSADHKQALAEGRRLGQSVREYLELLDQNKPRRGRKRTADSIKKRLERITQQLETAAPLQRVQLIQERRDLEREMGRAGQEVDLSGAEKKFVQAAKEYSARKGISYAAWREFGVPAEVLQKAGITRGG